MSSSGSPRLPRSRIIANTCSAFLITSTFLCELLRSPGPLRHVLSFPEIGLLWVLRRHLPRGRKAIPRSVTPVRIERDVGPLLIPFVPVPLTVIHAAEVAIIRRPYDSTAWHRSSRWEATYSIRELGLNQFRLN